MLLRRLLLFLILARNRIQSSPDGDSENPKTGSRVAMDAQKREFSQSHHRPNLKRPWMSPNEHFDTKNYDLKTISGRAPERAREHLRAGYLQGIITPEKNGYGRESPLKRIRSSNGEDGLEKHIFPRGYAIAGKFVSKVC